MHIYRVHVRNLCLFMYVCICMYVCMYCKYRNVSMISMYECTCVCIRMYVCECVN